MNAVRDYRQPLIEDPASLDDVTTVSVDETAFLAANHEHPTRFVTGHPTRFVTGHPTRFVTGIVDLSATPTTDVAVRPHSAG